MLVQMQAASMVSLTENVKEAMRLLPEAMKLVPHAYEVNFRYPVDSHRLVAGE